MKKILKAILIILIFIIEMSSILFLTACIFLNETNIKALTKTVIKTTLKEDSTMKKKIVKTIETKSSLKEEFITKAIDNSETANNLISDVSYKVIEYNISQNKKDLITDDELYNMASNNIEKIAEESNYELTQTEKKDILNYVKNNSEDIIDYLYSGEYND